MAGAKGDSGSLLGVPYSVVCSIVGGLAPEIAVATPTSARCSERDLARLA